MQMDASDKEMFNRFAKPGETFDEDWLDQLHETIREDVIAAKYWDSGAGSDAVYVYEYHGMFFYDDDFGFNGPYNTFVDAAGESMLMAVNAATSRIYVAAEYRNAAESAISLYDDLSKEDALALISDELYSEDSEE